MFVVRAPPAAWFSVLLFASACTGLNVERVGPPPSADQAFVVLLHGHGAPGDDLVGLAKELSAALPDATFIIPAAPHYSGLGRTWIPSIRAETREEGLVLLEDAIAKTSAKVWAEIEEARKAGVPCSEIVLAGFSLGGHMAAQVALRAPEDCTVGGLVVVAGGGLNDAKLRSPEGRAGMRVLVAHGKKDTVVPLATGKATARHFAEAGLETSLLVFEGSHQIAPPVREALAVFVQKGRVGGPVEW